MIVALDAPRWRSLCCALLLFGIVAPAQAVDGPWQTSSGAGLVNNMWQMMEWFLDRHQGRGGQFGPYWPEASPRPDYRFSGELIVLEGLWLTPAGEYWWVKGGRFALYPRAGGVVHGEYLREGHFLRLYGPWGEYRLEMQAMGTWLWLRDVNGQVSVLRRVRTADWNW